MTQSVITPSCLDLLPNPRYISCETLKMPTKHLPSELRRHRHHWTRSWHGCQPCQGELVVHRKSACGVHFSVHSSCHVHVHSPFSQLDELTSEVEAAKAETEAQAAATQTVQAKLDAALIEVKANAEGVSPPASTRTVKPILRPISSLTLSSCTLEQPRRQLKWKRLLLSLGLLTWRASFPRCGR